MHIYMFIYIYVYVDIYIFIFIFICIIPFQLNINSGVIRHIPSPKIQAASAQESAWWPLASAAWITARTWTNPTTWMSHMVINIWSFPWINKC